MIIFMIHHLVYKVLRVLLKYSVVWPSVQKPKTLLVHLYI